MNSDQNDQNTEYSNFLSKSFADSLENGNDEMVQNYLNQLSLPTSNSNPPPILVSQTGMRTSDNNNTNNAKFENSEQFNSASTSFAEQLNLQNETGIENLNFINISGESPANRLGLDDLNETWNNEQNFLSPRPNNNQNIDSVDDTASIYSNSSFNLSNVQNLDAPSPALSYLTTGEEDIDDMLSVYSGTSNYLLPVNSNGFKHISNLGELDDLLDSTSQVLAIQSSFNNDDSTFQDQPNEAQFLVNSSSKSTPATPAISAQKFEDVDMNLAYIHSPATAFNNKTDNFPELPVINIEMNDGLTSEENIKNKNINSISLLTPNMEQQHEEMRQGRIARRRKSASSRNSSVSRTRSISPESKARSLSENREKLLQMADLPNEGGANEEENPVSPSDTNNIVQPFTLSLDEGETPQNLSGNTRRRQSQKNPSIYPCSLCEKKFTRPYNLKSHQRTHTNERPYACTICGKTFAREHDRKRHEDLHTGKKRYVCGGTLKNGYKWGCGKKFARSDALGRHFKTESGRKCITPLYEEAHKEREGTTINFIDDQLVLE